MDICKCGGISKGIPALPDSVSTSISTQISREYRERGSRTGIHILMHAL